MLSRQFKNLLQLQLLRISSSSTNSFLLTRSSLFCNLLAALLLLSISVRFSPPTLCHFFSPRSLQCHLPVTRGQLHYGDPAAAQELQLLHHIPSGDRHLWVQPGTVQPPPQGEGRCAARSGCQRKNNSPFSPNLPRVCCIWRHNNNKN